jgi:hypothetical protein
MQRLAQLLTTLLALTALMAAFAATAQAAAPSGAEVIIFSAPIEGANPCTGESFTGEATYRLVIESVTSPSGEVSHHIGISTSSFHGVTASGVRYVGTFAGPNEATTLTGPGFEELTSVAMERVVRTGEDGTADDFSFRTVIGIHIDLATGEWTFFHSLDQIVCN